MKIGISDRRSKNNSFSTGHNKTNGDIHVVQKTRPCSQHFSSARKYWRKNQNGEYLGFGPESPITFVGAFWQHIDVSVIKFRRIEGWAPGNCA